MSETPDEAPVPATPSDPPGPYVITDLSLTGLGADDFDPDDHPERTPIGPFASRVDADKWASVECGKYGGGSWSIAPLRLPDLSNLLADEDDDG